MPRRGRTVLRKVLPHEGEEEEEEEGGGGEEEEEETEPRTLFSGATRTTKSLSKNLFTSRFGSYSVSRCCFAPRQGDLYSTRVTYDGRKNTRLSSFESNVLLSRMNYEPR